MTTMSPCKYWDCGWCYAPTGVETNAISGECIHPECCPYLKSQMAMTEMYGGNTPIVPEETIEKWEKDQYVSMCKRLVDDLESWMEYDAQPSRLPKEYRNTLELIMEARRFIKERRK